MRGLIRSIAFSVTLLATPFLQTAIAQSVINPTDPVVEYNPKIPPTPPDWFHPIVKWVRTKAIANNIVQTRNGTWNSDVYKAYTYNGLAFRVQFPKTYNATAVDGKKYPLLIFLHGQGENCSKYLPPSYNYDNHYQLLQGPKDFDAAIQNGNYDGYVLAPQLQNPSSGFPTTFYYGIINDIMNIVRYMIANNKVDPFHIVVNGLSEGGLGCWSFLDWFPTYVSSCAPMSSPITFVPDSMFISNKRYTPIWCSQGGIDTHPAPAETKALADSMNKYGVNFKETIYPTLGHSTWYQFWGEPDFWPFVNRSYSSNPWPLYGKNQFWPGEPVKATIGLNLGFEGYQWRRNGTTLLNDTINEIRVTGTGVYDARVKRDGIWSDWSHTPVTVKNNDYRIESEDWVAMNGVQIQRTSDVDGNINVTGINNGEWMDYSIAPYLTGTYTLKLRVAAATTGARFQIRGSDSTVMATVTVPGTGGPQIWRTVSVVLPLAAGKKNIRIKSITTTTFNINWMEFSMSLPSTLPVKFVYFNAQCNDGVVNLKWNTTGEQNTLRFAIQRSTDGRNWSEIGTVAAAGQSTQERTYAFADKAPAAEDFYRIAEYDYEGQTTISSTIRSSCFAGTELSLHPNPSSGNTSLDISLRQRTIVKIQVLDSRGAVLQQKALQLPAGSSSIPLNMSDYSPGIYTIMVQYNGEVKTLKLFRK
jgi:predicted esterase